MSVNSYIVLLQGEKGGDGDEGEKGLPGDPVSRHFRFFFFSIRFKGLPGCGCVPLSLC